MPTVPNTLITSFRDAWVSDASLQRYYEPFQYHLKGDHCAMVVNFDTHLLFGNPTTTLTTPAQ